MSSKFSCFMWLHTDVPELYVPVLAAAVDPTILWIISAAVDPAILWILSAVVDPTILWILHYYGSYNIMDPVSCGGS